MAERPLKTDYMDIFRKIIGQIKHGIKDVRNITRVQALIAVVLVGVILAGGYFLTKNAGTALVSLDQKVREVTVASVGDLASKRSSLPLIGEVTSISEATIRSESSGQITNIYKKLGDYVSAGQIIAEIENARERAALAQADAALQSVEVSAGISAISGDREKQLLNEARLSAINTIRGVYDSIDDSIRTKIDPLFSDATLSNPQFLLPLSNNQLAVDINSERLKISDIWKAEKVRGNALSINTDLNQELVLANAELLYAKHFVDDVISALNQSIPTPSIPQSSIDTYKISISAVRSALNAQLSALSQVKDNLTAKQAQYDIAQKQSGSGVVTVSGAALAQAQASIRLARVNLEKTIIRSPITGTLNSFSLERGDFVTAFQEVAVVSNNQALEIVAFITEDDAKEISVGAKTIIDGNVAGAVTKVAPALDPKTKKIEVRVGILGDTKTLVNGESVRVDIVRTAEVVTNTTGITIPISALKITADGPVVFTIEDNGTLKSHPVVQGALLGDTIVIKEGLTGEMIIVTDARGLKEGSSVTVAK